MSKKYSELKYLNDYSELTQEEVQKRIVILENEQRIIEGDLKLLKARLSTVYKPKSEDN
jgi:hypothetical protein